MKLITILIVATFIFILPQIASAQTENYYQKIKDANGNEMLLGICRPDALKQEPFASWFFPSWQSYIVDSSTCNYIRPLLAGKKLKLFLGTWCGDSRREVPRMLKMLECCNFPQENLELIMVSNIDSIYKQSPLHEERGYNIVRVPTLIILTDGTETGRIVEFPIVSLEKDLLAILKKQYYIPNYKEQSGAR